MKQLLIKCIQLIFLNFDHPMFKFKKLDNEIANLKAEIDDLKTIIDTLNQTRPVQSNNYAVPVGAVLAFAMSSPPEEEWLICDGRMYRKDLYPLLSDVLGSTFNQPDTPDGFFCVPDLQGSFIRGWDMDGNVDGEREFGSPQEDAIQGHSHSLDINNKIYTESAGRHSHKVYYHSHAVRDSGTFGSDYNVYEVSFSSDDEEYPDSGKGTTSEGYHKHKFELNINTKTSNPQTSNFDILRMDKETRPKNIALLYCIKAK